jgi:formate C-acetyltransferase
MSILKLKENLKKKEFVICDSRKFNVLDDTTRHYPLIIRKALAEKTLLEQAPVRILEGELIVGLRPQMAMPEYTTQEERDWAWNVARLTPYMIYGHNSPSYRMVLAKGLKGIIDDINRLRCNEKDEEKNQFWQAAEIACNAVIRYAERYAEEAERLCTQESDEQRRKELKKIADICRHVPANPARTFHEALQSVWFTYSALRIVGHTLIQFGRFDQYLYPFYEQDLRNGTMTKEDVRKLLQHFWIKCNMTDYVIKSDDTDNKDDTASKYIINVDGKTVYMGTGAGEEYGLQETGNNIILAGLTPDGVDGTNELTYLCLDVASELKLRDPIVSVRVHKNSPKDLLTKACKLLATGIGMPAFYNDEIIIPALQKVGISLQDARDYCNDGCIEVYSQGKSQDRSIAIWIDALKVLELALNNGKSYRNNITTLHIQVLRDYYATFLDDGDMEGPATGEASTIKSFEQLMENFKKHLAFALERHVKVSNMVDTYISKIAPSPLLSVVIEGCVEKGKDHTDGGPIYNNTGTTLRGVPNTAEALAAIKKVCFDEKKITLEELVEVLKNDFEGRDDIRKMLLECPKWGDNDDYVDDIVKDICDFWYQEVGKYTNPRGGRFKAGLWATAADHSGQICGASADGRRAGEAIATNLSPIKSRKGVTSFLNSAAKIDYSSCSNSSIVDIHLMPETLEGEEKIEKLVALIRTYFGMGGFALSFNVVSPETLIDAQKHPEQYKDLLVRVHGYSAHFITLSREYQNLIIERAGGFTKSTAAERDFRE